jgi:Z1 domain
MIGGNILGRGLTIDDLLVTYYTREARVPQMDTVWQHARMYGYRTDLMPFTRVYLQRNVARMFAEIHRAEEELRVVLGEQAEQQSLLIRVPARGRATRPNVLAGNQLRTIASDLDQIQPRRLVRNAEIAKQIRDILIENNVPITGDDRQNRSTAVRLEVVQQLIEMVPVEEGDGGRWSPGAVIALLGLFERELDGECRVYVRAFDRDEAVEEDRTRGRLSGPEISIIRAPSPQAPTLVLIAIGDPNEPEGWFPELVLPSGVGQYVTNIM